MNEHFRALLQEIYEFGTVNDQENHDKSNRMRNVTPLTGELLRFLVKLTGARRVLEIGTSNGYSTLWLANAVSSNNGLITSIEFDANKASLAAKNFEKSTLHNHIKLEVTDAGMYLKSGVNDSYDFIFMDSERVEYVSWWPNIQRVLVPGGTIVVDNTASHANELEPFIRLVKETAGFQTIELPIEQGILLVRKEN